MRTVGRIVSLFIFVMAIVGCQDYVPFVGGVNEGDAQGSASDLFNFSTVKDATLSVDFGERGSRAPIEIYTEDPTRIGEDGETYYEGDPEFAAFLDSDGRYEGTITLPAGANKVWVYSMRSDLPQMMPVSVSNGSVAVMSTGTNISGRNADGTPYGYSTEAAEADGGEENEDGAFKLINSSNNEDYGTKPGEPTVLKIWDTPKRSGATAGQKSTPLRTGQDNALGESFRRTIIWEQMLKTLCDMNLTKEVLVQPIITKI